MASSLPAPSGEGVTVAAKIDVAGPGDVETGEFEPQDVDTSSSAASTSITSSLYKHEIDHGRRVCVLLFCIATLSVR